MVDQARQEAYYHALLDDDAEQLYERAPCGYLSTAPDGTIIKINETLLTWLGHDRGEVVGRRTFSELLTAGGRIYHETHLAPLLQMQDRVRELALEMVRADGSRLPVLVNAVAERDAAGHPLVIRLAVLDATERRMYEQELLGAKLRAEESEARARALARTLQQTLIPPTPPAIPDLDVGAVYRPAGDGEEVGGDFFDVFQISTDDWVVVIGDVCGKGVEAAVVTALVRHSLRALTVQMREPGPVLSGLNDVLLQHETDRFCSVLVVRLHREHGSWRATVAAGGHPLPLVSRQGGPGEPVGEPGSLIGIMQQPHFHDVRVMLDPGDALVVFTDGVTEARREREFFGDERLRAAVGTPAASAAGLAEGILDQVMGFQGSNPRDDIAVVTVRVPEHD